MKKKTALTLSALALLSAGITFGVKFKQKKDFEKTLKTVLIPTAEKELDKLLKEDASLNDSIVYYHDLLLQQASIADGQRIAEKHNKLLGTHTQNMYSELDEISKTLEQMNEDYVEKANKMYNELEPYYAGDGEYYDMPKKLQEQYDYMITGITKPLANQKNIPDIPGGFKSEIIGRADGVIRDISFSFTDRLSFDDFANYLWDELAATRGQYITEYYDIDTEERTYHVITAASEIKQLLIAIKYFVNNIDNSKHIIKPEDINKINKQIDALMPKIEKQITLESTRDTTSAKLEKFKTSKKGIEGKIKQQQEKVSTLKTTEIRKLMKQQRGK